MVLHKRHGHFALAALHFAAIFLVLVCRFGRKRLSNGGKISVGEQW